MKYEKILMFKIYFVLFVLFLGVNAFSQDLDDINDAPTVQSEEQLVEGDDLQDNEGVDTNNQNVSQQEDVDIENQLSDPQKDKEGSQAKKIQKHSKNENMDDIIKLMQEKKREDISEASSSVPVKTTKKQKNSYISPKYTPLEEGKPPNYQEGPSY